MSGERKSGRRDAIKVVGSAVGGLVIGAAIGYLAKPAELIEKTVTSTVTGPATTVTAKETVTQTVTVGGPTTVVTTPSPTTVVTTPTTVVTTPTPTIKPGKITFWHCESYDPTAKAFVRLADKFAQKYPGSSVDISVLAWGDVGPKISSAMAAGAPPEVTMGTFSWISKFADMGVEMPLDDLYNYWGNDVFEASADMCYYKGHYYAVHCTIATDVLVVRKDYWEEYVDMPWPGLQKRLSWNEWLTALDQLTRPEKGIWGLDLAGKTRYFIDEDTWMSVGATGGAWYDDQGRVDFDNDKVIQGLEYYAELTKHCPPGWEGRDYLDTFSSLVTGRVAAAYGWPRAIGYIEQYAPAELANQNTFGVILKPVPPGGRDFTQIDDNTWHVFSNSKNPDLGKEWLKFFMEPENYVEWCKDVPIHLMPIRKSALNLLKQVRADYFNKWGSWLDCQQYYIDRGAALPTMGFRKIRVKGELMWDYLLPYVFELRESGIIADMAMDVALGRKSPQDAARDAQKRAVELLVSKGYQDYVP